jgi:hypothetical protein
MIGRDDARSMLREANNDPAFVLLEKMLYLFEDDVCWR